MSHIMFEKSYLGHPPENDQEHETDSTCQSGIRISAESSSCAQRIHKPLPRTAAEEVPTMVILATLQCLEAKMDHLQHTMEDMPIKAAEIMKQIWLAMAPEYFKKDETSVAISPSTRRDCMVCDFPGKSNMRLKPLFSHEPDQQQNYSPQALLTDGQRHENQCVQPLFINGPGQIVQPVFTGRQDRLQSQHLQPVVSGGEGTEPNQSTKLTVKQHLVQSLKIEALCPDEMVQEGGPLLQHMSFDDQRREQHYSLEPLCMDGQNLKREAVFSDGNNADQDCSLTEVCPDGQGLPDTPPSLASDTLPADEAASRDLFLRIKAQPEFRASPGNVSIIKTKWLQLNPGSITQKSKINITEDGQSQSMDLEKTSTHSRESQTPCTCTECGESFTDPSSFLRHQSCNVEDTPQKCIYCEMTFIHHSQLKEHLRSHMGEKSFACNICRKSFINQLSLIVHKRSHKGERRFKCTECEKSFAQRVQLEKHQRVHTGERPYQCTVCAKSFSQRANLYKHQMIHTRERPYKCTECDKTFIQKSDLCNHQRIHSGEKPFKCTVCGRHFRWTSLLKNHLMIHSGEKPYKCTECGEHFIRMSTLKLHQRTHLREKPVM
ncbi:zinc finger protein 629-like [Ambystoma mexicanum]|uniref:zinc finger protein 629-like n=1 Tax=Ambystoma mexicanum TaxID=8296 RepID=UPI0037E98D88